VVWNFGFWSFVHCFGFRISRFGFLPFGRVLDRFNDLHVAGAHAQIASQRFANFRFGWIGIALQKCMARHYHARRAVTALKSVVLDECFLDGTQFTVFCETFDRCDFTPIRLHREMKTGFYDFAIEQHGASPTLADDAADMSPSEADVLAQKVRKKQPRLDVFFVEVSVDRDGDRFFHQTDISFRHRMRQACRHWSGWRILILPSSK